MKSGATLAHYQIAEMIGKGGMGEVYRARDTKLDRDVALKILPGEFASDRDRMARFDREAKMLASLHHPNIASIFGFETTDACTFLVMELVEGEDLSEALRKGPLPVDEAVDIARQIAEGLEEAHEKGIVHRDLKPANVKRTPDGRVKVLDFGLARVFSDQSAGEEEVASQPTMTAAMTQVGTVLGTAAYMSPEQARGHEVDRRADIWAFGVILFEMLTGRQTFVGETASDTLAGILKSEPEWDQLPENVPFQVDRVLRRCLAKDPRQRLRDIGEARVRLEDPTAESGMFSGPIPVAAVEGERGGGVLRFVPWALLAVSLVALGWLQFGQEKAPVAGTSHLAIPAPDEIEYHITGSFPGLPEMSPDGRRLAFSGVSQPDNRVDLYLRDLDSEHAVLLGDTRDAQYPFWSPDSRWLAYYSRGSGLFKIPVDGGPAQKIADATNGKGGSWNQNGDILYTTDYNTSIMVTHEGGGEVRSVTNLASDKGFNSHRHPQFMPDGRHFLYLARGNGRVDSEIRFASLDDTTHTVVTRSSMMGYYGSGHLVYAANGNLVAQPMDPDTGLLSGSPTPLVGEVMAVPGAAKAVFSLSGNGNLIYLKGDSAEDANLSWRTRSGQETEKIGDLALYDMVALSPDERSAVVGIIMKEAGTWDLWIIDLERNFRTRFTIDPSDDSDFVWSSDSRGVYFTSDRGENAAVYFKEIGSQEGPRVVYDTGKYIRLWDVSDDEQTLIYSQGGGGESAQDLWSVNLSGEPEPRLLRGAQDHDVMCRLSPDEQWVAFASRESGTWQVYVAPWPAMTPLTQVSIESGTWSQWTKEGRELIFLDTRGYLNAVSMAVEGDRMRIGQPEQLYQVGTPILEAVYWSAAKDGERILTVNLQSRKAPAFCNLVTNWPAILEGK